MQKQSVLFFDPTKKGVAKMAKKLKKRKGALHAAIHTTIPNPIMATTLSLAVELGLYMLEGGTKSPKKKRKVKKEIANVE